MTNICDKIEFAMRDKNLNARQTAIRCGLKYSTFHSALRNKSEFGISTIKALCDGLGISLSYFSDDAPMLDLVHFETKCPLDKEANDILSTRLKSQARHIAYSGTKITLESFLDWWVSNSGRLEAFDQLAENIDLFEPPTGDSSMIKPVRIGSESLATKCFYLEETDHLKQTLNGFTKTANEGLVQAHLEAFKRGEPIITHPFLDENLRDGTRFVRRYRRVLAPTYRSDGKTMIVNFSQDISTQ